MDIPPNPFSFICTGDIFSWLHREFIERFLMDKIAISFNRNIVRVYYIFVGFFFMMIKIIKKTIYIWQQLIVDFSHVMTI